MTIGDLYFTDSHYTLVINNGTIKVDSNNNNPTSSSRKVQLQKSEDKRLEGVTCKGCQTRSQDLEQSSTINTCTDRVSSDTPTCNLATWTLTDSHQPLEDWCDGGHGRKNLILHGFHNGQLTYTVGAVACSTTTTATTSVSQSVS